MICTGTRFLLLFLTFNVYISNPKKLEVLYTVANPARTMLNRKNRLKEASHSHSVAANSSLPPRCYNII